MLGAAAGRGGMGKTEHGGEAQAAEGQRVSRTYAAARELGALRGARAPAADGGSKSDSRRTLAWTADVSPLRCSEEPPELLAAHLPRALRGRSPGLIPLRRHQRVAVLHPVREAGAGGACSAPPSAALFNAWWRSSTRGGAAA